ncbi:MAG: hypothetical protein RIQ93_1106 [Verrucomicrobiota bacterium]
MRLSGRPPLRRPGWFKRLLFCGFISLTVAAVPAKDSSPPFRSDRILLRPARGIDSNALQPTHTALRTEVTRTFTFGGGAQLVKLPPGLSVAQAIARFQQSGLVDFAEPDYLLQALVTPDDPRYPEQWNLHNTGLSGGVAGADIMAESGWDLQRDASSIIVAVVDSGVRVTHEDLAANLWVNPGESGLDSLGRDKRTNGIDDDGNGYVDDVHGINVLDGSGNPVDQWGHGTHVAGIVGAAGNNARGVSGVAWRVKIMACKFIGTTLDYSVSDAITCLDYARGNGARIVTASWGGYAFTSVALQQAISALRSAGIIMAAATGNDNSNNDVSPLFPASYDLDNIIAVAATDRTDARAAFSNFGATTVDLGAPGASILSTWSNTDNDYVVVSGTSMAAPHVAGACALLWARFPTDSYAQIIQRIFSTVDPAPGLAGISRTGGRLNLAAALASGSPPPPSSPPAPTGLAASATSSSTINLTWTDNSASETGFEIQRSVDNVNFVGSQSTGANTTSASVTGLTASTTYFFRVRALQGSATSTFSNTASATTAAASAVGTWLSQDIGAVAAAGSTTESGGVITLVGSGADIWDNADEFRFRYQNWTGDGEITARVTGVSNTDRWAKAAVMWRESLSAGSRHALMCVAAVNGTAFQWRSTTNGGSSSVSGAGKNTPRWVRLIRSGSTITAYESANGTSWAQVGAPLTLTMNATIYVGLAVTSHNDGALCTATFDNVTVNGAGSPPPPPAILPAPTGLAATATSSSAVSLSWTDNATTETGFEIQRSTDGVSFVASGTGPANATSASITGLNAATIYYFRVRAVQDSAFSAFSNIANAATQSGTPPPTGTWESSDIGAVAAAGSVSEAGCVFSLTGSGADIWDGADEFRYRYQSWTGDGEMTARLTAMTNTHGWAKAGVMFRETLAANSRHALMCVSATNGTAFQGRAVTGGPGLSVSGTGGSTLPRWVRLRRQGNAFTGYESANGVTWTQVSTLTLDSPATIYVGLAVTSHNDGVLCTATFDNVANSGGSAPPPAITVTAPGGLAATAISSSRIDLSWNDASNNESGFQIERSTDGVNFSLVFTTAANATTYSDAGLSPATTYSYRVRALADTVYSGYSNIAAATTPDGPPTVSWFHADVGAVGVAGSDDASGNTITVRGSGSDVWENSDAFRFVYREVTGDCTVETQVSSITNTHAWAKAGVMIRDSLAANARNAFAFITPTSGVAAQLRQLTGGATISQSGIWGTAAPHWVRLVRAGSHIVAYQSPNGATWTQIAAFDVALNTNVYVGFAVTSHNNTALNTAVLTDPFIQ